MFIGLRVIRGPDWSSGESDGGEGHVGTVATIEDAGAVDVIWDSGQRNTCRAGKDGRHDLRVFDSGSVGIHHKGITCCACDTKDFFGTRWTCTQCKSAELCFLCYSGDKHDLGHVFRRHDIPGDTGVQVKKRTASLKIRSLGLFPGARVVRGEDWKWGTQDGGPGSKGKVIEVETEQNVTTIRNIVRVKWDSGRSNIYRVGHEGKVDIKYIDEAPGLSYYREHMQVLDIGSVRKGAPVDTGLSPGCKVCIQVDKDELKQIQTTKGGWSAGLAGCVGKFGVIKTFPTEDVASVEFGSSQYRIAKEALLKVHEHSLHDVVRILTNKKKVILLQEGHGEWSEKMENVLGKVGRVMRVDSDGDVVVVFGSTKWIFNPACCIPAPGERVDDVETKAGSTSDLGGLGGPLLQMLAGMLDPELLAKLAAGIGGATSGASSADLFKAIMAGNAQTVRSILKANPQKVNDRLKGLTPLMIACHEGQVDVVSVFLDFGADLEVTGHKGVTALATALIGEKEVIAQLLIERGAKINVTLNDGQSTLHLAVHKNLYKSLRLLIKKGGDVNAVDASKDTPLHDAIQLKSNDCIEVLLESKGLNLRLCNKGNFNQLHLANIRGNVFAVEKILERDRSTVDVLMADDSFSALHIAAANDHVECARLLIDKGKATIERKGQNGLTPLHIAASRPMYRLIELLLDKGADVNSVTEIGDTPLHVLFVHCSKKKKEKEASGESMSSSDLEKYAKSALLLLKRKAAYNQKNLIGAKPLQLCKSERLKLAVKKFIDQNQDSLNSDAGPALSPLRNVPTKADDQNLMSTLGMALPCCKCYSSISDVTLRPCNHKVLCQSCCDSYTKCPMCDSPIHKKDVEMDPAELCKVQ